MLWIYNILLFSKVNQSRSKIIWLFRLTFIVVFFLFDLQIEASIFQRVNVRRGLQLCDGHWDNPPGVHGRAGGGSQLPRIGISYGGHDNSLNFAMQANFHVPLNLFSPQLQMLYISISASFFIFLK